MLTAQSLGREKHRNCPILLSPFPKKKVERFLDEATTTQSSLFTNSSRHVRFAAAQLRSFSPVRPRPRLTHTTKKLFPTDLQDEAERIRDSNAEEDVNDLPEQERKCTQGLVFVMIIFIYLFMYL